MILGETTTPATHAPTLDQLFRRAGIRDAAARALTDPPNRRTIDGQEPLSLTYGETDRAVTALARKLIALNLPVDSVVAYQLANTVESIVMPLAILRAGMIAAPLPVLWRKADIVDALTKAGAKAIVTSARIGDYDSLGNAMQVAAELFPIRYVGVLGSERRDGVVSFGALLAANDDAAVPVIARTGGEAAAHVAVITFEMTGDGVVPVARSHAELFAAGQHVTTAASLAGNAGLLSPTPATSFAGLGVTLMPWLIAGGAFALHHGFDYPVFAAQCSGPDTGAVVIPSSLIGPLAAAGALDNERIASIIALWRNPEALQVPSFGGRWRNPARLVDVAAFGEIGLLAVPRSAGRPAPIAPGGHGAAIALMRDGSGTLALSGAMTPAHDFPPGGPIAGLPQLHRKPDGFIDTGYRCESDPESGLLTVTGAPDGVVRVGGYSLARKDLDTVGSVAGEDTGLAVLPNALTGQRIAASGADPELADVIAREGLNALLSSAFTPSKPPVENDGDNAQNAA